MRRRYWFMINLMAAITLGLTTLTLADSFMVGQSLVLKAKKAVGVPLHHDPEPSYWKHVPDGTEGTILHIAQNGWLHIALATGEEAWVHPKYVKEARSDQPLRTKSSSPSSPPLTPPQKGILHVSSEEEETQVWESPEGCEKVIRAGGRMGLRHNDNLRIGTWNIRWFPYGQAPDQSVEPHMATDISWLTCTLIWMNLDLLGIEESLDTVQAKQAWKRVRKGIQNMTGETWLWTPQRCGDPDSHQIGFLWNATRVDLQEVRSLKQFNVKAQRSGGPCEGGLRPGHYAYVQSRQEGGVDFHIIALHLKSGPTVFALEDRHRALNQIDQTVRPFLAKDQDIVILGDFNTMGAGDEASRKSELKYLRRMVAKEMPGFQDLPLTPSCSHYFKGRGGWLDHVLVNHGMAEAQQRVARVTGYCATLGCQRIKGEYPLAYERLSDHCPVIIEIENLDKD